MVRNRDRIVRPLRTTHESEHLNRTLILASGIADLVKSAVRRGLSRFTARSISYDSDVFRYTQLSQHVGGGLYAGKDKRLSTEFKSLFNEDNFEHTDWTKILFSMFR